MGAIHEYVAKVQGFIAYCGNVYTCCRIYVLCVVRNENSKESKICVQYSFILVSSTLVVDWLKYILNTFK